MLLLHKNDVLCLFELCVIYFNERVALTKPAFPTALENTW